MEIILRLLHLQDNINGPELIESFMVAGCVLILIIIMNILYRFGFMEKYRPSNSTEGFEFETRFCYRCINDSWNPKTGYGKSCKILENALLFSIDDPKYPGQWCYDESTGSPKCTAFSKELPFTTC